jgi:hypothetical protein
MSAKECRVLYDSRAARGDGFDSAFSLRVKRIRHVSSTLVDPTYSRDVETHLSTNNLSTTPR